MLLLGETDAGELDGVEAFLLATVPVAISAGAAVGAAAINADAVRYTASQQRKATVLESLSALRAVEIQANAETRQQELQTRSQTQALDTGTKAGLVALGLLLLLKG